MNEEKYPKVIDTYTLEDAQKELGEINYEPLFLVEKAHVDSDKRLFRIIIGAEFVYTTEIIGAIYGIIDQFLERVPEAQQNHELQYIINAVSKLSERYIYEE